MATRETGSPHIAPDANIHEHRRGKPASRLDGIDNRHELPGSVSPTEIAPGEDGQAHRISCAVQTIAKKKMKNFWPGSETFASLVGFIAILASRCRDPRPEHYVLF
jgi:hypothetical protein